MIGVSFRNLLSLITTCCVAGSGPAFAEYSPDEHFEGYMPTFQSGDTLPKDGAFAIALQPAADIAYFTRRHRDVAGGYGGIVTLESIAAGRYVIVLSQNAQLDILQQRSFVPLAVTRRTSEANSPITMEIAAEGEPLTLQLSGVAAPSISVAVIRLPD